mmetsp:Transcript_7949/g.16570  ORF Transcript_7949/g.16570 Transcript_7949/m.16570 type:complete len:221 (-) Transcript_7949:839-1501(-)
MLIMNPDRLLSSFSIRALSPQPIPRIPALYDPTVMLNDSNSITPTWMRGAGSSFSLLSVLTSLTTFASSSEISLEVPSVFAIRASFRKPTRADEISRGCSTSRACPASLISTYLFTPPLFSHSLPINEYFLSRLPAIYNVFAGVTFFQSSIGLSGGEHSYNTDAISCRLSLRLMIRLLIMFLNLCGYLSCKSPQRLLPYHLATNLDRYDRSEPIGIKYVL